MNDWVELVEVDGSAPPRAEIRRVDRRRRASWQALAALGAGAIAFGSVLAAAGAHHHQRDVVDRVTAAAYAADALSCPVGVTCGSRSVAVRAIAPFGSQAETELYDVGAPRTVFARALHAQATYQHEPATLTLTVVCGPPAKGARPTGKASSAENAGSPTFTSSFVRRYPLTSAVTCVVDVWCIYAASFADGYPNASPAMERLVASIARDPQFAP